MTTHPLIKFTLGALCLVLAASSASAVTDITWLGNTDTDWATGANWSPSIPNNNKVDALFFGAAGSSGTTLTNTLTSSAFSINALTFNSGASAYTFTGNTFSLSTATGGVDTGLTNDSSNLQTFANTGGLTLLSNSFTITTGAGITITNGLGDNGGTLTSSGAGTLTLGGFTLATSSTGAVTDTLTGTSAIDITGAVTNGTGVGVNNLGSSLTYSGTGTLTLAGNNTFTGKLTQSGTGTTILSGDNSGGGFAVSVSVGTLDINNVNALPTFAATPIYPVATLTITGGTIDNTSGGSVVLTTAPTLTLGSSFTFGGTNSLDLGSGLVSGDNTAITLAGSTSSVLTLGEVVSNENGTPTLAVNGAGHLLQIRNLALDSFYGSGGFTTTIDGSGNVSVLDGVIRGSYYGAALTYSGTGTLTLGGVSDYGATTISSGTVALASSEGMGYTLAAQATFGTNSSGTLQLQGYNLTLGALSSAGTLATVQVQNGSATTAATLTIDDSLSYSFNGILANGGAAVLNLTKAGAGTLTINGASASTYTGATTINGGTLSLDLSNATTPLSGLINSNSALVMGGGTLSVKQQSGVASAQTFANTSIAQGGSEITTVPAGSTGDITINLGAVSRSTGAVVDITPGTTAGGTTSITTTTADNSAGILGGWATVGGANWAVSAGNGTTAGAVTALSSYTTLTAAGDTTTTDNDSLGTTNLTLTGSVNINSLKNTGSTSNNTLNNGGNNITFQGSNGGFLTTSSITLTGAGIVGGGASGEFIANVATSSSTTLTVDSQIIGDSGGATDTGNLTKAGIGKMVVNSANDYTGGTYVDAGTLVAGNTAAFGAAGADITLNDSTLDLTTDTSVNAYNLTVSGASTVVSDKATASSAGIAQALGTLAIGGTTLNVTSGANVSAGSTPLVSFGAVTLTANDDTTTFNPTTAGLDLTSTVTGSAGSGEIDNLALNGSATDNQIVGAITDGSNGGSVALTAGGTGAWTLDGANTYTGQTVVNSGTLTVNGTLGNTAIYVYGGTLNLNSTNAVSQNALTTYGTVNVNATNALSGSASLTVAKAGVTNIATANNFTGLTTLAGGSGTTLLLGNANAIADSNLLVTASSTLQLRSDTTNALFADASTVVRGGLTLTIDVDQLSSGASGNTLTMGNLTTSNGNTTFTNNGGADDYNFAAGTDTIASSNVGAGNLPVFTNNMVNGTATLGSIVDDVTSFNITFNGTSATATTVVGGIAQASGAVTVTQSGSGTLNITAASTYTGATSITSGSLLVNNTSGSATGTGAVALGAANLGGTGIISGLVTASGASGASVITPATISSIGNLTLSGGMTSAGAGLTLDFAIDGTGATNSTLTLGSAGLSVTGGLNFNLYDLGTNTLVANTVYTLVTGSGPLTADSITANLMNSDYTLNTAYAPNGVLLNGDVATFEVEAVPEPGTWAMMLGGLGFLVMWQRRKSCGV